MQIIKQLWKVSGGLFGVMFNYCLDHGDFLNSSLQTQPLKLLRTVLDEKTRLLRGDQDSDKIRKRSKWSRLGQLPLRINL